jgi:hypothetical protein
MPPLLLGADNFYWVTGRSFSILGEEGGKKYENQKRIS